MSLRCVIAFSIALVLAAAAGGQTPAFEVASVKPNHTTSQSRYPSLKNGTLTAENWPLRRLFAVAYGLNELCILGPSWMDSEKFDIVAKAPEGVADTEVKTLLQSLLKDRFKAEAHSEIRDTPAFEMVPAKDGIKLKPFDPANPPVQPRNRGGSMIIGVGTMTQLASMLTGPAGKPVIDKTGVDGRFTYILTYTTISTLAADSGGDSGPPDLFAAVQQQLGLRLDPKKEPVEFLVIDHVERVPTEN